MCSEYSSISWWSTTVIPEIRNQIIETVTRRWYKHTNSIEYYTLREEDWDVCLWLDGCRYDIFEELWPFEGDLESRHSAKLPTFYFLEHNFSGQDCSDTIYVTAHPMYRKHDLGNVFHTVDDVWIDGWDKQLNTVPPSTMAKRTLKAIQDYPNKRILSHWMQPHYPFIGKKGQDLVNESTGFGSARLKALGEDWQSQHESELNIWNLLEENVVKKDKVWKAYSENLELTFPHIEDIIDEVDGRLVITSDHGNHFGEFATPLPIRVYGHPRVYTKANAKVPWLVIEGNDRREITSELGDRAEVESKKVNERLEKLGYIDGY